MKHFSSFGIALVVAVLASAPARAASLRGSHASLAKQNDVADEYGIPRIKDETQLERMIEEKILIPIEDTKAYYIDETLGEEDSEDAENYAYARRSVEVFLNQLLPPIHRETGYRFRITSLVRTLVYQRALIYGKYRSSAARGQSSDRRSPHLTGLAVDISRKDMPAGVMKLLRARLKSLEDQNVIEATEEKVVVRRIKIGKRKWKRKASGGNCFHVMVFPNFGAK